jgi:hypothetical protein
MQDHRSAGDRPAPRPNPSPAIGHVHALGESHALRVDLQPVQVPWLADEVETLRASVSDALAQPRARHAEAIADAADGRIGETSDEVDRRVYQLRVLTMIREQLPLSAAVVEAVVADPWQQPSDRAWEAARITAPVTVVGPARAMLVLLRGAARNVADALGEALRGPDPAAVRDKATHAYLTHWPEWHRVTPAVASRLRELAAAAEAFTEGFVAAVAQQAYSFDPEHYPVYPDELW